MAKIILTNHAKERMEERDINFCDIEECLEFPDYKISKGGKVEFFKNFRGRTLRLVCVEKSKFIKVVTLVWK